jgi:hypothetical protein
VGNKSRITNIKSYQVKKAEAVFDGVFDEVSVEEDIEGWWFHCLYKRPVALNHEWK